VNELYLMLGSNLGDRLNFLETAANLIEQRIGKIFRESSIYETEPYGNADQPYFINQIVTVLTNLSAIDLMKTIMEIEEQLGRTRTLKWAQRNIDIDILLLGNEAINETNVIIPHAGIEFRNFVLVPLNEIIPDFVHPVINKTIEEIKNNCKDKLAINVIPKLDN
jgi:2-amino-4-hydroxy-6-hydroxymethyldihydropteridine diphosphokinase